MGVKASKTSYTFITHLSQDKTTISNKQNDISIEDIPTANRKKKTLQEIKEEVSNIEREIKKTTIYDDNYIIFQQALHKCSQELDEVSKNILSKFNVLIVRKRIFRVSEEMLSRKLKTDINIILDKLEKLKKEIKIADKNKDLDRLEDLTYSMDLLTQDLHSLNTHKHAQSEEQKANLEKNLLKACQQLMGIKQQLKVQNKEKRKTKINTYLEELEDLESNVENINGTINEENYEYLKEELNRFTNKLNSIENFDKKVVLKKSNIMNLILNINNNIIAFEVIGNLKQADLKLWNLKIEIIENCQSDSFADYNDFLENLRNDIIAIPEINNSLAVMKKTLQDDIDDALAILDRVIREKKNED